MWGTFRLPARSPRHGLTHGGSRSRVKGRSTDPQPPREHRARDVRTVSRRSEAPRRDVECKLDARPAHLRAKEAGALQNFAFTDKRTRDLHDEAAVSIQRVTKAFGNLPTSTRVLDDVTLDMRRAEFFSLLGPSGCGKTTLLRILAGFEAPDEGRVLIGGRDMRGVPPHARNVNTVFQSYALFPHLTVLDNVTFGLRMQRLPASAIRERAARALDLVRIADLASRRPHELSGGQRQRVALARAIVLEPDVLLLDEPLSALDLKLRKELQLELAHLQATLGMTFVFVTHDQDEALVMSDRIAVMRAGRVEQVGRAEDLYERPRTAFVANFLGTSNLIEGTVVTSGEAGVHLRTPLGDLRTTRAARDLAGSAVLSVRPEKLRLVRDVAERENTFPARVTDVIYTGAENQYVLTAAGLTLRAVRLNSSIGQDAEYAPGDAVAVTVPPESLVVLEGDRGEGQGR